MLKDCNKRAWNNELNIKIAIEKSRAETALTKEQIFEVINKIATETNVRLLYRKSNII